MTINAIKKQITPILAREGVVKAAIFGSAARGTMEKKSDIDLLVKLKKGKTLLEFVGLKLELEGRLKKKVDMVEYDAIKPVLKNFIMKEQKIIYEQKRS